MLLTQCCSTRLAVTRLPIRAPSHIYLRRRRGFASKQQPPPVRYEPDPDASPENVQNEFIGHTLFAFRGLGRMVAFIGYGVLIVGVVTATAFEGGHLWIERQMRIPTDEDAKRWGWQPEGWTGGDNGGTSSSLGFVGRHAVRAAWFSLHNPLPFGDTTATISQADGGRGVGSLNVAGPELESARVYLENAMTRIRDQDGKMPMDRAGSELLERHAAVLTRMGTRAALKKARDEYLILVDGRKGHQLSQARFAVKIGDISERLGDEEAALTWWTRGIHLTSDDISSDNSVPSRVHAPPTSTNGNITSTFWKWTQRTPSEETFSESSSSIEIGSSKLTLPIQPPGSPVAQRTLVTALLSISAHYSKRKQFKEAKRIQEYATSLIDGMVSKPNTASFSPVESQSPGQALHQMYLLQRKTVLALHHAEVTYSIASSSGRRKSIAKILTELLTAASLSEMVAQVLTGTSRLPDIKPLSVSTKSVPVPGSLTGTKVPYPIASHASLALTYGQSPWLQTPALSLLCDARRTVVEAWDLCGVLYGEVEDGGRKALECYERALGWAEEGMPRVTSVDAWQSLWERYTEARKRV